MAKTIGSVIILECQHCRPLQSAGTQIVERPICLLEGLGQRPRLHRNLWRQVQEFLAVTTGQVRYRTDHTLTPQ
jgi:hypothetical protein